MKLSKKDSRSEKSCNPGDSSDSDDSDEMSYSKQPEEHTEWNNRYQVKDVPFYISYSNFR